MDRKKLQKLKVRLYGSMPLTGGWLRRRAAEALARDGSLEAVRALAEAVTLNDDREVRAIALEALRQLADQSHEEAQEALCRLVIDHDHPLAREIAVAAQYAPREPHQRALFYFLTEQWEKYEQLDFDQEVLEAVYEVADEGLRKRLEGLRKRLAERARRAGRVEWVGAVVGGRQARRLGEMTDEEWEAALAVLSGSERWEEVWRLAQAASAVRSVRLLRRLKELGWVPNKEDEQAGFAELVRLAERCVGDLPELDRLVYCRAALPLHTDWVTCLAISPNGRLLASGGELLDDTVRLWQLPDGAALKALRGHRDGVSCLAISPDGRVMASGGGEGTVQLWQLPSGTALETLREHRDGTTSLAISPDGQVLVSGSLDRTVQLWSLPDGTALKALEHTREVRCLAISPDGRVLASGDRDSIVRLWRLPDGTPLKTLRGHTDSVHCLVISPDGRLLASGSFDGTVRLWRLPGGAELKTLEGHIDKVTCLAISPDGRLLASGSLDGAVRLWGLPDGKALKTLVGHTSGIRCLAFSPDGRVLASGGLDSTVRLWRLPDGAALKTLEGHRGAVTCLAISPDGRVLASGSWDKTVRLWGLEPLRLGFLPVGQTNLEDMTWVQETLRDGGISDAERRWLEFLLALMRWRRRFDIEIGEAPSRVPVGEFDIEIE